MPTTKIFTAEWFPYYFERFEDSDRVAGMTLAEEGAYHRAIRIAWKYGSVSSDPKILASKIAKRCSERIAAKILNNFEPDPNNPRRMIHPVLERIRNEQERKHLVKVRGGKKAAATFARKADRGSARVVPKHNLESTSKDLDKDLDIKRLIRRAREANAKVDARFIELGILYTLLQRNGSEDPIRSIHYFDPQIKRIARESKTLSDKAIDVLLRRRREQYAAAQGKTS